MLDHGLVICNGKGGVGKSSVAAGLAANAAAAGRRTLLIDLDPTGSIDQDLGYRQSDESDDGRALYRAVVDDEPLVALADVRTNLDVVPAGDFTQAVYARVEGHERHVTDVTGPLERLGATYDLVVFDTPPGHPLALDIAFAVARFVIMPVGVDTGSLDGLEVVSDRYHVTRTRGLNPALEPLGVVLFGMDPAQPRLHREVRADVTWELDGAAPVLDTFIRHRPRAARDLRRHGLAASEYLRAARDAWGDPELRAGADSFDDDAAGLAQDYWDLTDEVLDLLDAHVALPAAAADGHRVLAGVGTFTEPDRPSDDASAHDTHGRTNDNRSNDSRTNDSATNVGETNDSWTTTVGAPDADTHTRNAHSRNAHAGNAHTRDTHTGDTHTAEADAGSDDAPAAARVG